MSDSKVIKYASLTDWVSIAQIKDGDAEYYRLRFWGNDIDYELSEWPNFDILVQTVRKVFKC